MDRVYTSLSVDDLSEIASKILDGPLKSKIFTFNGQLGAGKTTLIKSLCRSLGCKNDITSPTFSISNEYVTESDKIYHMDLYRIKDISEAMDIGLEEYLYSGHYCFIEWPNFAEKILQENYYSIDIQVSGNHLRKIEVSYIKSST